MVDKARVELTSRGGLRPALPSATYPYKLYAEHLIRTLSLCEISIVYLLGIFEPNL